VTAFSCSNCAKHHVEVPVVAIFTKFDGLVTKAFNELREDVGFGFKRANNEKVNRAETKLLMNFIEPLMTTKFPPSDHVHLSLPNG
jgi:hypothetical protein